MTFAVLAPFSCLSLEILSLAIVAATVPVVVEGFIFATITATSMFIK